MEYLDPSTIEGAVAWLVLVIGAVGAGVGRIRRAIIQAVKKARGKA